MFICPRSVIGLIAACVMSSPPVNAQQSGFVFGYVHEEGTTNAVADAKVEALIEGVFPVASTYTSSAGEYLLEVPFGLYDLRVTPVAGAPLVATTVPDRLVQQVVPDVATDIELRSHEKWLTLLGGEAGDFTDSDGDRLPDELELHLGLDPLDADTNGDGVDDGVSVAVGADPHTGPADVQDAPSVVYPPSGLAFPTSASGNAPFGLTFRDVTGATGYRATLVDALGVTHFQQDLDLVDGDFLLGEDVTCSLSFPTGLVDGAYELTLQGYYGTSNTLVGTAASLTIDLFDATPTPLVVTDSISLSGMHFVSSVFMHADTEIVVPDGQDLTLVIPASGTFVIESGATLRSADGSDPGTITILTSGDSLVRGTIEAGDGASRDPMHALAPAGTDLHLDGLEGDPGGDVRIHSFGQFIVTSTARIQTGTGGDGAHVVGEVLDSMDAFVDGGSVEAVGGRGGDGGALTLDVDPQNLHVAIRAGVFHVGNGGDGGDVLAYAGGGGPYGSGGGLELGSGVGGDSGDLTIGLLDLDRDGVSFEYDFDSLGAVISGGDAGTTGHVLDAVPGEPGSPVVDLACGCDPGKAGLDEGMSAAGTVPQGATGGDAWGTASAGQDRVVAGGAGTGCLRGGDAWAHGGTGGKVIKIGGDWNGIGVEFSGLKRGRGGNGGRGTAAGGNGGGDGTGRGGRAFAWGGRGGNAKDAALGIAMGLDGFLSYLDRAGDGGEAKATMGTGMEGYACPCEPDDWHPPMAAGKPGGPGGPAGTAEAYGGDGGNARMRGDGGKASVVKKDGGKGGKGTPGGSGGSGAHWIEKYGTEGSGFVAPSNSHGLSGWLTTGNTQDGKDGDDC